MPGMTKPVVGVIGNAQVVNDRFNVQVVGQRNLRAVAEVAGALPTSTRSWARSTGSC